MGKQHNNKDNDKLLKEIINGVMGKPTPQTQGEQAEYASTYHEGEPAAIEQGTTGPEPFLSENYPDPVPEPEVAPSSIIDEVEEEATPVDEMLKDQPGVEPPPVYEIDLEDPEKTAALEQGAEAAAETQRVQDEVYGKRMADMRPVSRDNKLIDGWTEDMGDESSVIMSQSDNKAFPLLFPKEPGNKSRDPNDWIEYPPDQWREALAEAERRGEVFEFDTPEQAQRFAEGSWKPQPETSTKEGDVPKVDSFWGSLGLAAKQTALYTAPAAMLDAFVAEQRSFKGSLEQLDLLKKKGDKRVANINLASARRLRSAITDLEYDKNMRRIDVALDSGERAGASGPKMEQRKKELLAKKDKLNERLAARTAAWNAYMAPVLAETAKGGKAIVKFTQKWMALGQETIGRRLKMTTDDVHGIGDFFDYLGSSIGQSLPYSIAAMTGGAMSMVRVEQGSIMGDMYHSMMESEGLTLDEVFDRNIDQRAADIALTEGLKAGALESAGELITVLAPWAKMGIKAGTVISKSMFKTLLQKAGAISKKLLAAAVIEGVTENRQTKLELAAVLKNAGYTEKEIEGMIGWEQLKEATFTGFFASSGTSMPSTAVRAYVEIVKAKREADAKKAIDKFIKKVKPEDIAPEGNIPDIDTTEKPPTEPTGDEKDPTETEVIEEPEGPPEAPEEKGIAKDNPVAKRLQEQIDKWAEEGDERAQVLSDEFNSFKDDGVLERWIDEADTFAKEKGVAVEEEAAQAEIPDEISVEMKFQLLDMGETKESIDNMSVEDAWNKIKESKKAETTESVQQVRDMPVAKIEHDLNRFQDRRDAYSQESVDKLQKAWDDGTWDINKMDAIKVWTDPNNGRTYVLAGHSRKRFFELQSEAGHEEFDKIPTIDVSYMSEAEAKTFATKESNYQNTTPSDLDVASTWRKEREGGMSNKEIGKINENIKNLARKEFWSYLNPNGKSWSALEAMMGKSTQNNRVKQIGDFLGDARQKHEVFTDAHENEMYDWLAEGAGTNLTTRPAFMEEADNLAKDAKADPDKPLNIANKSTQGPNEASVRSKINKLHTKRDAAKARLKAAIEDTKAPKSVEDEITKEVENIKTEIQRLKDTITQARKSDAAQTDLFDEKPTPPPATKDSDVKEFGEILGELGEEAPPETTVSTEPVSEAAPIEKPDNWRTHLPSARTYATSLGVENLIEPKVDWSSLDYIVKVIEEHLEKAKPTTLAEAEAKLITYIVENSDLTRKLVADFDLDDEMITREFTDDQKFAALLSQWDTFKYPIAAKAKSDPKAKSEKLKEVSTKLKDEFKDILDELGKGDVARGGIVPVTAKDIEVAARLIAKAGEMGINQFQQLVAFIEENFPGWLDDKYDLLKGVYSANRIATNPYNESFDKISKQTKEDAIQEGKSITRDAGPDAGTVQEPDTETEGSEGETESGQGAPDAEGSDTGGTTPKPSGGISEGGNDSVSEADRRRGRGKPTGNTGVGEGVITPEGNDFFIPGDYAHPKTFNAKRQTKTNLDALRVLRDLKEDGDRAATQEEQEILFGYAGWGGIKDILLNPDTRYGREDSSLQDALAEVHKVIKEIYPEDSKEVIRAMQAGVRNAFYTPTQVVRGVYNALTNLGVKGNMKILEPSAGTGNFLGAAPPTFNKNSFTAVEVDRLTSDIAKKLYPSVNHRQTGLQKANLPEGYYDLVVSNIPFGTAEITDKGFIQGGPAKKASLRRIHNYFFLKGLDLVRPGGVVAFVTSSGVLDSKRNDIIRREINKEAEFLGAVKLPSSTFRGNAGTSVTADIIFLRKHNEKEASSTDIPKSSDQKHGFFMNTYWDSNPDNMLGEFTPGGYQQKYSIEGTSEGLDTRITAAIGRKPAYKRASTKGQPKNPFREAYDPKTFERAGNLVLNKGKKGIYDAGDFIELESPIKDEAFKDFITLRATLNEIYAKELDNATDEVLGKLRETLRMTYDNFVMAQGRIGARKNVWIYNDIDGFNVAALEVYDNETKQFAGLADIFTKRTLKPIVDITSADNPKDAINVVLNDIGEIDLDRIASLLGVNKEEAIIQTKGLIYELPSGGHEIANRYLSGNVRKKLKQAEAAAEADNRFEDNIHALKAVLPADLPMSEIAAPMGAHWIPFKAYELFAEDVYAVDVSVEHSNKKFVVATKGWSPTFNRIGTERVSAEQLFGHALNNTYPDLKLKIALPDGTTTTIMDETGMAAARMAIDDVRAKFEGFVGVYFENNAVDFDLKEIYNSLINNTVKAIVDGSYLTLPGYAGPVLRTHQLDAVATLLQNTGGIIDHIVGSGKTLIMIVAAMEMKRLGIAKKPMITAVKNTVNEIAKTAREAYPAAKILSLDTHRFNPQNRKATLAKIANNDWDLIVLSHDNMKAIPPAPDMVEEIIQQEVDMIDNEIAFWENHEDQSTAKKEIQKLITRKEKIELKYETAAIKSKDQEVKTFDLLGVDHMFVDESHTFKNLPYQTKHGRVKGLSDPEGNETTRAMLFNVRHLQKINKGDKGVTFLSGTTVTNSIVELYNILAYLRPNKMQEAGMETFDKWAATFTEKTYEDEITTKGQVKPSERFRKFNNLPELGMLYAEIADIRNDLNLQLPRPDLKGGTTQLREIEPSKAFRRFTKRLLKFAESGQYRDLGIPTSDGEVLQGDVKTAKVVVAAGITDAAGIDMRLVFKDAPEERESKLMVAAEDIFKNWESSHDHKGVQLVFLDRYKAFRAADTGNTFNAHVALKEKLIEYGIPAEQIEQFKSGMSDTKRDKIFVDTKAGNIRVLIGHKRTMGTGLNVQDRVIKMHHIDIGWNPASHTQADGRGRRQGNHVAKEFYDNTVESVMYGMKFSMDAFKHQTISRKAQFILQLKEGSTSERTIVEEDGDNIAKGVYVAALTGNVAILDKAKIESKLKRLELERRAHNLKSYSSKKDLETQTGQLESAKARQPKVISDIAYIKEHVKFDEEGKIIYKVKLGEQEFTKGKEFGTALWERMGELYPEMRVGEETKVGEIYGHPIVVTAKAGMFTGAYDPSVKTPPHRLYWYIKTESGVNTGWGDKGGQGFIAGDPRSDEKLTTLGRFPVEALKRVQGLEKTYDNLITKLTANIEVLELDASAVWDNDQLMEELKEERKVIDKKIKEFDLSEKLGDVSGPLWPEEDAELDSSEPLAAGGTSKSKGGEKGRTGASIGSYPKRAGQRRKPTDMPWKIFNELLALANKWVPDALVGERNTARGSIGTFFGFQGNKKELQKKLDKQFGGHIRVKGLNDFDVFIHELMHAIDQKYKIYEKLIAGTENGAPIRRRLTDIYEKFYPGAKRSHKLRTRMKEGLAVIVQRMATDPTATRIKYGDIIDQFFVKGGEFAFDGVEEYVQDIESLIIDYQQLDPLAKVGAGVFSKAEPVANINEDAIVSKPVSLAAEYFDNKAELEDIMKRHGMHMTDNDIATAMRYVDNTYRWTEQNLNGVAEQYWSYNANMEMEKVFDFNFRTIDKMLKARKDVKPQDFGYYLYGRRILGDFVKLHDLEEQRGVLEDQIMAHAEYMKTELSALEEAKAEERAQSLAISLNMVNAEIHKLTNDEHTGIIDKDGVQELDAKAATEIGDKLFKEEAEMLDKLMWEDAKKLHKVGIVDNVWLVEARENIGYYAPFRHIKYDAGLREQMPAEGNIKGKGGTLIASTLYRSGSERPTMDPFEAAHLNHIDIMRKVARQHVYNKLAPLQQSNPEYFTPGYSYDPGKSEEDPDVIIARINGKRIAMKPHQLIKRVIDENFTVENVNIVMSAAMGHAQWVRTGITGTWVPFVVTNFIVDQFSAFTNSKHGFIPLISPLIHAAVPMMRSFFERKLNAVMNTALTMPKSDSAKFYNEYRFLGGLSQTFLYSHDIADGANFKSGLANSLKGGIIARTWRFVLNTLSIAGLTSEVATRATEYIMARKNGMSQDVALEQAGRVSTPFHHMGRWKLGKSASMKQVVASIPYSNASFQVTHQMYRTWTESKSGRARILGVMGMILAAKVTILMSLLDGDDDDQLMLETIKAQEPEILTRYMFIPYDGVLYKFRMPENYAFLGAMANMAILQYYDEADYGVRDVIDVVTAPIPKQFNLLEPLELLSSWVPPGPKTTVEVWMNKKTYPRIRDLVSPYRLNEIEDPYASESANQMSKLFYEYVPGSPRIHPRKIDHFVTGMLGRTSKILMRDEKAYPWEGEVWARTLTQQFYMNSARQVINYGVLATDIGEAWSDAGDKKPAELKHLMNLIKGKQYKVSAPNSKTGTRSYTRHHTVRDPIAGTKAGIEDLLQLYGHLDPDVEPARATAVRNEIFRKIKEFERAYDAYKNDL